MAALQSLDEKFTLLLAESEKRNGQRFDAQEKAVSAALAAAEKAVTKAEVAAEKRFDSVNEFRNAMKDQQNTFADKMQTDFRLAAIEKRLEGVVTQIQTFGMLAGFVITGVGAFSGLIVYFLSRH